jgi:hypothetical protein
VGEGQGSRVVILYFYAFSFAITAHYSTGSWAEELRQLQDEENQ